GIQNHVHLLPWQSGNTSDSDQIISLPFATAFNSKTEEVLWMRLCSPWCCKGASHNDASRCSCWL
ncbi:hypothetical protein HID58_018344, partial [Brassica napus]